MKVRALLFAAVRDRIGSAELVLELPAGSTIQDARHHLAQTHPAASELIRLSRLCLNSEYAALEEILTEGAEIAVIPPVSGGANENAGGAVHAEIVREPIRMDDLSSKVSSADCGAALTFAGSVRADVENNRRVRRITYEGYEPMAGNILRQIADTAARRFGARVAAEHRLGTLNVGEISIGIAVACPHRADGFAALREIIEEVKKNLPVWKKEEFSDGAAEWVHPK